MDIIEPLGDKDFSIASNDSRDHLDNHGQHSMGGSHLIESNFPPIWRTLMCKWHKPYTVLYLAVFLLAACSGSKPAGSSEQPASMPTAPTTPVSMNKDDYPVFPDADAGADPSVPAEQGGKGFKGEGWETNTNFALQGDPRALKGGLLRDHIEDFPGTLRMYGPE